MNPTILRLANAPIVEAVLDIDCDMSPGMDIAALEGPARDLFREQYPKFRKQLLWEHQIKQQGGAPPEMSARQGIQAFQFLHDDEKQLVQVRSRGFSFNRLAPYSSLDNYLPEIERSWGLFVGLAAPIQVKLVRLRYINRILLPMEKGKVELNEYLTISPRVPDEDRLVLAGFLNQYSALETGTGNQVNIVLTAQPQENGSLPVILDIEAFQSGESEPSDWSSIQSKIQVLRDLKNRLFEKALTKRCLQLFQM